MQMIVAEQGLEVVKIDLSLQGDFSLQSVVSVMDPDRTHNLTKDNLRRQLQEKGLFLGDCELDLVFARISSDGKQLDYSELSNCFLPCDPYYANQLIVKRLQFGRQQNGPTTEFKPATQLMLNQFWTSLLETERCVEQIRKELAQRQDFEYKHAFKSLDNNLDGVVSVSDVSFLLSLTV